MIFNLKPVQLALEFATTSRTVNEERGINNMNQTELTTFMKNEFDKGTVQIKIANALNNRGVKAPDGKKWTAPLVSKFCCDRNWRRRPHYTKDFSKTKKVSIKLQNAKPNATVQIENEILEILATNISSTTKMKVIKSLISL